MRINPPNWMISSEILNEILRELIKIFSSPRDFPRRPWTSHVNREHNAPSKARLQISVSLCERINNSRLHHRAQKRLHIMQSLCCSCISVEKKKKVIVVAVKITTFTGETAETKLCFLPMQNNAELVTMSVEGGWEEV